MSRQIGERIGALLSGDSKSVKLIGFGIYAGDEVPPADAGGMAEALNECGVTSPKLILDDGQIVWGCECWWDTESEIRRHMEGHEIIPVNMTEARGRE